MQETLTNCVHNPAAIRIPRQNLPIQNKALGTDIPHDFMVKGTTRFWVLPGYVAASLDWVTQHNWTTLQIKELN